MALTNECPIATGIYMDELQKDNFKWKNSKNAYRSNITNIISLSHGIYEYLMIHVKHIEPIYNACHMVRIS